MKKDEFFQKGKSNYKTRKMLYVIVLIFFLCIIPQTTNVRSLGLFKENNFTLTNDLSMEYTSTYSCNLRSFVVKDDLFYGIDVNKGLVVLNVSVKNLIKLLANYPDVYSHHIVLKDNFIFMGYHELRIFVYNSSGLFEIEPIDNIFFNCVPYISSLNYYNNTLALSNFDRLVIFNITDIYHTKILYNLTPPGVDFASFYTVYLLNNYLLVSSVDSKCVPYMLIINATDMTNLTYSHNYDIRGYKFVIDGSFMFTVFPIPHYLVRYDITDMSRIIIDSLTMCYYSLYKMKLHKGYLFFIETNSKDFNVFSVSQHKMENIFVSRTLSKLYHLDFAGNYAYVSDETGLLVYKLVFNSNTEVSIEMPFLGVFIFASFTVFIWRKNKRKWVR